MEQIKTDEVEYDCQLRVVERWRDEIRIRKHQDEDRYISYEVLHLLYSAVFFANSSEGHVVLSTSDPDYETLCAGISTPWIFGIEHEISDADERLYRKALEYAKDIKRREFEGFIPSGSRDLLIRAECEIVDETKKGDDGKQ